MKLRIMDGKRDIYDDKEWEMLSMCQDTFEKERKEFIEKCKKGEFKYSDVANYFSEHGIMQEIEKAKEKYSEDQLDIYFSRKKDFEDFIRSFAKRCVEYQKIVEKTLGFFSNDYLKQLNITKSELIKLFEDASYKTLEKVFLNGPWTITRKGESVLIASSGIYTSIMSNLANKCLDSKHKGPKATVDILRKFSEFFFEDRDSKKEKSL